MASFEPVVVLFGSQKNLLTIHFRLPVSFVFAVDEDSLEELIFTDQQLHHSCLQRYFLILLETISKELFERLQNNHRIQTIYTREPLLYVSGSTKPHRIINQQLQQFTLDLTADIVQFWTNEGAKQVKLERSNLTEIYYRQARLLKEWAMSFAKAEPSHILIIPLNTNKENLDSAVERIKKICLKLGHPSVVIRTPADYLPLTAEKKPCLLPYNRILFTYENPQYICQQFLTKLCPIRLYLYGNEESISSQWSEALINQETTVMEDEDSWCAFIENEYIIDEIKWNIGPMLAGKWKVKRIVPINLTGLDGNLRFQSALCRALKTFDLRQIDVTSQIFKWYDRCVTDRHIVLEPTLPTQDKNKFSIRSAVSTGGRYRNISTFRYGEIPVFKSLAFIWLDEILTSCTDDLNEIIQPFSWNFFQNVPECLSFIENQAREEKQIFLVSSGSLGRQVFASGYATMRTVSFVYIYCSQLEQHNDWMLCYGHMGRVFNDLSMLQQAIKVDFEKAHRVLVGNVAASSTQSMIVTDSADDSTLISVPITVFDPEQKHIFAAHQRTIDTLLCLPQTDETRLTMLNEFRRIYADDSSIQRDVDLFEQTYNSHNALQWYTRDSFLFRLVNQALRFSNADLMFKLSYFLIDLYAQLDEIHRQAYLEGREESIGKVYRGQNISRKEFHSFEQIIGRYISINTFFSTTTSLQIALLFANSTTTNDENLSVIFCIETDSPVVNARPYANISQLSTYNDEEEVLFSMGSLFLVQTIHELDRTNPLPVIYLKLIDPIVINNRILS